MVTLWSYLWQTSLSHYNPFIMCIQLCLIRIQSFMIIIICWCDHSTQIPRSYYRHRLIAPSSLLFRDTHTYIYIYIYIDNAFTCSKSITSYGYGPPCH